MCGLAGVFAFTENGRKALEFLPAAKAALAHRGPDAESIFSSRMVGLAHTRLSIISPSPLSNQPLTDASGRYTIILNGEIFNYKKLRDELIKTGCEFKTDSDTEVVLQLYIQKGQEFLKRLRGFFAFAIYDAKDLSLFIARDRFGEKPILYYKDADRFLFGSELAALFALGVPRELDFISLYQYLQLTYVPAPASMLKGVKKLQPGHALFIKDGRVIATSWYKLPYDSEKASANTLTYLQQQLKLKHLLRQAVEDRLVADVPVGAFLSGGIDSSITVGLASEYVSDLRTFSVGFPEHPYFDETHYARLVANKYKTNHTEVQLTTDDLYANLFGMLDSLSEPFADSSALAVYALSQQVSKTLKVVLSGDGADELFGGYNKHVAEYKVLTGGMMADSVRYFENLWNLLPKSRNSFISNKVRQLQRFAEGANLSPQERYWFWATWQRESEALQLLRPEHQLAANNRLYLARKSRLLDCLNKNQGNLNDVLCADWQLVLANDMLPKIDLMGMANGLEIRSPFLDHRVVKYGFSLPASSKINKAGQKRILLDTFQDVLPKELLSRPKKGFEIPLHAFLNNKGREMAQEFLSEKFVEAQGIFSKEQISIIRQSINGSNSSGVMPSKVWTLLVFQHWWQRYMA